MDAYKKRSLTTCYIGKTKFSAGIFLSHEIARRKAYGKHLKFVEYDNWEKALDAFLSRYKNHLDDEDIIPNKLYSIYPTNAYSVFYSPYYVGITYSKHYNDNLSVIMRNSKDYFYAKHNLTYEDAVSFARGCFSRYWKNPNYYILQDFHLHSPIALTEVKSSLQRRRI